MTCKRCKPRDCIAPNGVCHGDFYTTGEYGETLSHYNIHGVSFNEKIDRVKHYLDYDTIQILKALLVDNDAPIYIDTKTELDIVKLLDIIQLRLSYNMDDTENYNVSVNNSYQKTNGEDVL